MKGLKDATNNISEDKRLDTELMQNKLQESLKLEKKKGIEVDTIIVDDSKKSPDIQSKKVNKDRMKNLNDNSTVNS